MNCLKYKRSAYNLGDQCDYWLTSRSTHMSLLSPLPDIISFSADAVAEHRLYHVVRGCTWQLLPALLLQDHLQHVVMTTNGRQL